MYGSTTFSLKAEFWQSYSVSSAAVVPEHTHARTPGKNRYALTRTYSYVPLISSLWNLTSPLLKCVFFSSPKIKYQQQVTVTFLCLLVLSVSYIRAKSSCCVLMCNDLTCSYVPELDSSDFTINSCGFPLTLRLSTSVLFFLSPNSMDEPKFFDHVTPTVEHILSEISILDNFSVHHHLWFSFSSLIQMGNKPSFFLSSAA